MGAIAGLRLDAKMHSGGTKCVYCDCRAGRAVKTRLCNGTYHVWLRCRACGENMLGKGIYLRHKAVELETLPLHIDHTEGTPLCERCGTDEGVELHHWAPREWFEDDCDLWPTGWLCPICHAEWHLTIGSNEAGRKEVEGECG